MVEEGGVEARVVDVESEASEKSDVEECVGVLGTVGGSVSIGLPMCSHSLLKSPRAFGMDIASDEDKMSVLLEGSTSAVFVVESKASRKVKTEAKSHLLPGRGLPDSDCAMIVNLSYFIYVDLMSLQEISFDFQDSGEENEYIDCRDEDGKVFDACLFLECGSKAMIGDGGILNQVGSK